MTGTRVRAAQLRPRPGAAKALAWIASMAALAGAAGGCAGDSSTAIVVEIRSDHAVPDEVDELHLRAEGLASGGLLDLSVALRARFPHTYAVVPGDDPREAVAITVTARREGETVARAEAMAEFAPGKVRTVAVRLGTVPDGGPPDGAMEPDGGADAGGMRDGGLPDGGGMPLEGGPGDGGAVGDGA